MTVITDSGAGTQTDRQTDIHTDRQTDRHSTYTEVSAMARDDGQYNACTDTAYFQLITNDISTPSTNNMQ